MLQREVNMGAEEELLSQHICAICKTGNALPPVFDPRDYDATTFTDYIAASNNRREYICQEFELLGWTARRDLSFQFNLSGKTQMHGRERHSGTNTIIAWEGSDFSGPPSGLYCGHTDYCAGLGAIDNASGCAALISLARAISVMNEMRKKVWFVLFDQEENDRCGSRDFAEWMLDSYHDPAEKILAAVNLDGVGEGRDIVLSNGSTAPSLFHHLHERLQFPVESVCTTLSIDPYWRMLESDITSLKGLIVNATLLISSLNILGSSREDSIQELKNIRAHTSSDVPEHVCIASVAQATRLALQLMKLVHDLE